MAYKVTIGSDYYLYCATSFFTATSCEVEVRWSYPDTAVNSKIDAGREIFNTQVPISVAIVLNDVTTTPVICSIGPLKWVTNALIRLL